MPVNGKTMRDELRRLFELVNELPEGSPEQQEAWDDLADFIFGTSSKSSDGLSCRQ